MNHKTFLLAALSLALPLASQAQKKAAPTAASANAESAIRESDIKRDLFALGGDHFRGREAGSLDELKASAWLEDQIRATGALPAGDDGTYFQFFQIQRTRITKSSTLTIGSHALKVNHDALLFAPVNASVNAPMVWVGNATPPSWPK
ncbi:hypothetical protein [Hymenobacter sp. BRD67]|uniref:hypothetical protein n=1 Tax=Hymenobacter sp. BRD67 TaxID=2675877 RepID=UPI00293B890A|nr:hypothetical protein [Hymenobacter sp. BRD67]